jgi:hypothetical protein
VHRPRADRRRDDALTLEHPPDHLLRFVEDHPDPHGEQERLDRAELFERAGREITPFGDQRPASRVEYTRMLRFAAIVAVLGAFGAALFFSGDALEAWAGAVEGVSACTRNEEEGEAEAANSARAED